MNEDFTNVLNKFSTILKEKDIDLNKIVGGENEPPTEFHVSDSDKENCSNNDNVNQSNFSNDFNLDIETILKIKNIMNSINKSNKNPRNTLLFALKPYLENNKKEKLEQYIKIANLLSVLENFDSSIKIQFSESNYDFILILTLFLLLF